MISLQFAQKFPCQWNKINHQSNFAPGTQEPPQRQYSICDFDFLMNLLPTISQNLRPNNNLPQPFHHPQD
jgi:hypothetical protein